MGAVVFKQPNGLLGRYSHISDGITHFNMTPEEYIVSCIDRSMRESKEVLERYLGSYEDVISAIKKQIKSYDDLIKDAEDEEARMELVGDKAIEEESLATFKADAENEPDENTVFYHEFCKEMCDVLENLCVPYDYVGKWDIKEKDYQFTNNPEHVKKLTEKLKEINKLYNELKNE